MISLWYNLHGPWVFCHKYENDVVKYLKADSRLIIWYVLLAIYRKSYDYILDKITMNHTVKWPFSLENLIFS